MTAPTFFTVPHDPIALGEVPGKLLRIVRIAARVCAERELTAEALRARPNWNEQTLGGAAVRTAVRWGLIR